MTLKKRLITILISLGLFLTTTIAEPVVITVAARNVEGITSVLVGNEKTQLSNKAEIMEESKVLLVNDVVSTMNLEANFDAVAGTSLATQRGYSDITFKNVELTGYEVADTVILTHDNGDVVSNTKPATDGETLHVKEIFKNPTAHPNSFDVTYTTGFNVNNLSLIDSTFKINGALSTYTAGMTLTLPANGAEVMVEYDIQVNATETFTDANGPAKVKFKNSITSPSGIVAEFNYEWDTIAKYNVVFYQRNGTTVVSYGRQQIFHGEFANKVTPATISGYQFVGWKDKKTNINVEDIDTYPIVRTTEFVAQYKRIINIIFYDSDKQTILTQHTLLEGESVMPPDPPVKENLTFKKWVIVSSSADVSIEWFTTYQFLYSTSFFASYTPTTYRITFLDDDGKTELTNINPQINWNLYNVPTGNKAGYQLIGWDDGVEIHPADLSDYIVKGEATFTAVYIEISIPPTITASSFVELNVGDTEFDVKTGVSANDSKDGDLTARVQASVPSIDTSVPGFHVITYTVQDNDGNLATPVKRVVLVNDGTYVVGDTYVIKASDFTKRISQVEVADAKVIEAGQVQVFEKATGSQVANPNTTPGITVDNGGYEAVATNYTVTYTVVGDDKAETAITATVEAGATPTITGPTFTEVAKNGTFEIMKDIEANDPEDGTNVRITAAPASVDTAVAGVTTVVYTATDSDGNTATHTQVVLVNDGTYVVGDTYIIKATDFTKRISEVEVADDKVIEAANVQVFEKATGTLVANPSTTPGITVDNGGYEAVATNYTVTFTVVGDTKARTTITATVEEGAAPTITGPTFTEVAKNGTFEIMKDIEANDPEDGTNVRITAAPASVDTAVAGVTTVVYTATDSDGNTATHTQVVLVNDETYIVGDTYIIKATDFTKRISEVEVADAKVIEAANVQVFDKATGTLVANPSTTLGITVDNGGYEAVATNYTVTFTVVRDTKARTTITASVIEGAAPTITGPTFTEVAKGGTFDIMKDIVARDTEDGTNLTITAAPASMNTAIAGIRTITYTATDSDGNQATHTQVVLVNDGTFVAGDTYIIKATDFTRRVSEVVVVDMALLEAGHVEVFEKATGALVADASTTPGITIDNGGYKAVATDYTVTFTVVGDVKATIAITATVEAGEKPTITGPTFTEVATFGAFEMMKDIEASDTEDGTNLTITAAPAFVDTSVAGVTTVVYSVTDSDGNTETHTQVVLVNDGTFVAGDTYIIRATDFMLRVSQVNAADNIVLDMAHVQVFEKATGAMVANPSTTPGVTVDNGGYEAVATDYTMSFTVVGDVKATATITASVIEGATPTINGPTFTEIAKNGTFEIMKDIIVRDDEDGTDVTVIAAPASVNTAVAGITKVTYTVTDSDGNQATHTQVVLVNDGNHVVGTNYIILANDFTKLIHEVVITHEQVKLDALVKVYMKATGEEVTATEPISVNLADYTNEIGEYAGIKFTVDADPTAFKTVKATVVGTVTPPQPTAVPTVVPTAQPTPNPGRTCQDDGYPAGYTWNGIACVAGEGVVKPTAKPIVTPKPTVKPSATEETEKEAEAATITTTEVLKGTSETTESIGELDVEVESSSNQQTNSLSLINIAATIMAIILAVWLALRRHNLLVKVLSAIVSLGMVVLLVFTTDFTAIRVVLANSYTLFFVVALCLQGVLILVENKMANNE